MVIEEVLSPTTFVTEWTSIGSYKMSDFFFWWIFPVSSPDYYEILTFPIDEHKSRWILEVSNAIYINTIYFFLKYNFFFWRAAFFNETVFFLKIELEKWNKAIFAKYSPWFYFMQIWFFSSVEKVVTKANQISWLVNWS